MPYNGREGAKPFGYIMDEGVDLNTGIYIARGMEEGLL